MDEKLDSLELLCKELANVPSSAAAAAALATMGNNTSLANGLFGAAPSHGLHDEHRADGDQSGIGERGGQQYEAVYLQEASAAADGQGAHASSDPTVVRSALQAAASAAADAAQSADGAGGVSAAGSAGAESAAAASVAAAAQAMVDQGAAAPAGQGSHVGTGSTSGRPLTAGG